MSEEIKKEMEEAKVNQPEIDELNIDEVDDNLEKTEGRYEYHRSFWGSVGHGINKCCRAVGKGFKKSGPFLLGLIFGAGGAVYYIERQVNKTKTYDEPEERNYGDVIDGEGQIVENEETNVVEF